MKNIISLTVFSFLLIFVSCSHDVDDITPSDHLSESISDNGSQGQAGLITNRFK